ncbi:MAG: hypothetical protein M0T77_14780 [Actinomycetota bacterium]|nr:hypothetical protein [Actinomycetota bacterium]
MPGRSALSGVGVAAQYSRVQGVGQRPAFLGVLSALLGAGSILAALSASRLIGRFGQRALAIVGLVNFAAGNLLRADHWLVATLNVAQRHSPDELQGRLSAALTFALFGPKR